MELSVIAVNNNKHVSNHNDVITDRRHIWLRHETFLSDSRQNYTRRIGAHMPCLVKTTSRLHQKQGLIKLHGENYWFA